MPLQVFGLHRRCPSKFLPSCHSLQLGFLLSEVDIAHDVEEDKVVEGDPSTFEFPVFEVVDRLKVHDPPPNPVHSPLLWSTAALKRWEVGGPRAVFHEAVEVDSRQPSEAPPGLAPLVVLDPGHVLELRRHLGQHEVLRPHGRDRFPWAPPHHLEDGHQPRLLGGTTAHSRPPLAPAAVEGVVVVSLGQPPLSTS